MVCSSAITIPLIPYWCNGVRFDCRKAVDKLLTDNKCLACILGIMLQQGVARYGKWQRLARCRTNRRNAVSSLSTNKPTDRRSHSLVNEQTLPHSFSIATTEYDAGDTKDGYLSSFTSGFNAESMLRFSPSNFALLTAEPLNSLRYWSTVRLRQSSRVIAIRSSLGPNSSTSVETANLFHGHEVIHLSHP